MDPKTRAQLLNDYKHVQSTLNSLLEGNRENRFVVHSLYLSPTVVRKSVPLYDPAGEYQHFKRIRNALEAALVAGSIRLSECPPNSPKYLSDLVG